MPRRDSLSFAAGRLCPAKGGIVLAIQPLRRRHVARVWGRRDLPAAFMPPEPDREPIGELWFEGKSGTADELLVKFLFTAEKLSIQVHPDDEAARARGLARGKDEAWFVLSAEPDAVIGLGLRRAVSAGALREAAVDGGIEELVDWRNVAAGEAYYSPAGTIHAIGAGLILVEFQQNLDLTYRLYDYGRPRELHLDEAIEVASSGPWSQIFTPVARSSGRQILAAGRAFVLERWTAGGAIEAGNGILVVPIESGGRLDGEDLLLGMAWSVDGDATISGEGIDLLAAYPGGAVRECAFSAGAR